jgi:hypothetical protein
MLMVFPDGLARGRTERNGCVNHDYNHVERAMAMAVRIGLTPPAIINGGSG